MATHTSQVTESLITAELIERRIYLIRGHKVMLDSELAELYQVPTKVFNQAVTRKRERFPEDFMFQLTKEEDQRLRSQFVTSKMGRGGRRYRSYVFTEQGVAMLSSVLNSERAVQVNIAIMRAFVRLREILSSNKEMADKLDALEKKYDAQFRVVFQAIRKLMESPPNPRPQRIGFRTEKKV
jgi:phage regulator Rha-like protein